MACRLVSWSSASAASSTSSEAGGPAVATHTEPTHLLAIYTRGLLAWLGGWCRPVCQATAVLGEGLQLGALPCVGRLLLRMGAARAGVRAVCAVRHLAHTNSDRDCAPTY